MGLGDMFGRSEHRTRPRSEVPELEASVDEAPRRVFRDVTSIALDEESEKSDTASDGKDTDAGLRGHVDRLAAGERDDDGKDTDPGLSEHSNPSTNRLAAGDSRDVGEMPAAAVLRRADTTRVSSPRVPRAPEDKNVRNREDDGREAADAPAATPSEESSSTEAPSAKILDDTMEVPQASTEIAQKFWGKMQPSWTIDEGRAALERGVKARVRDEEFGPLDLAGLKLLLRSDIWLGAVELEFEERWLPMARHPLLPLIEEELRAEARDAMLLVTASTSAERERSRPQVDSGPGPEDESRPPARPPEIPERLAAEDQTPTRENPAQSAVEPGESPAAASVDDSEIERAVERGRDQQEEADGFEQDSTATEVAEPALPEPTELNALPTGERDTPIGRIAVLLTVLAAVAIAGILTFPQWKDYLPRQPAGPSVGQPTEALRLAFTTNTRARAIAGQFAELREQSTEELHDEIRDSVERADFGSALSLVHELRRRQPGSPELVALQARALSGAGEWAEARMVIIEAYAANPDPELKRLFARVVRVDPTLRNDVKTIGFDTEVDVIKALGGGRSISLKMKRDGENVFAFKPGQTEWEQGWRVEVAAWRFCQVASCDFDIPRSMSARVSREDFEALYPMDSLKQRKYAERFEELVWVSEPGPDGVEREYLYGVLKDWVPHFTDWPIEYTHVWEPWLNVDGSIEVLDQPLGDAIKPLAIYKDGEYYRQIMNERGEASTRSVARQISNVMIFDYLTNNWDRFSTNEDYYGVNNQFADGRFVSIDNGACFHLQSSIRVDSRFEPVERMSATFVASVRLLDRSWSDGLLFPNSSLEERLRLDVLWNRREQFLERVDTLVEKHGQDEVLVFR